MEKVAAKKKNTKQLNNKVIAVRERIKPRGLAGLYRGKIFYDKSADIFNLEL